MKTTTLLLILAMSLAGCAALAGYETKKIQKQQEEVLYKTLL